MKIDYINGAGKTEDYIDAEIFPMLVLKEIGLENPLAKQFYIVLKCDSEGIQKTSPKRTNVFFLLQ